MKKINCSIGKLFIFIVVTGLVSLLLCQTSATMAQESETTDEFKVAEIRIEGNQNIPRSEIVDVLNLSPGDKLTPEKVKENAQKIIDLGYFSEVTSGTKTQNGSEIVRFVVTEYPKIEKISFEGNELVKSSTLRDILKKAGVKKGEVFNKNALSKGIKNILDEYEKKGYPIISTGDVNIDSNLTIEIIEGRLKAINVEGLLTIPEEKALEFINIPQDKPVHLRDLQRSYQALSQSIYFRSIDIIPRRGYDQSDIILEWQLTERRLLSETVSIEAINLTGNTVYPSSRLEGMLNPQTEKEISNYELLTILKPVYDLYREHSFTMVQFKNKGTEDGVLTVSIEEGNIKQIEVKGNEKTSDKTIRNQMVIKEGVPFNSEDLQSTRRKLLGLGYFNDVSIESQQEDGEVSLTTTVKEKNRLGSVNGGLAWSGTGINGNLTLSRKNLFGLGQDISLDLKRGLTGGSMLDVSLNWKNVFYPPQYNYTQLKVYKKSETKDATSTTRQGVDFSLSYPLARNLSLGLGYNAEQMINEKADTISGSISHIVSLSLSHDTRDNPMFATQGGNQTVQLRQAGWFSPGLKFTKLTATWTNYFSIDNEIFLADKTQVFALRIKSGLAFDPPPAYTPTIGGSSTIRGIKSRPAPRYGLFNTEYRLELIKNNLYGKIFFDIGSEFEEPLIENVHSSVGLEANLMIAGYLRMGVAWTLTEEREWMPKFYFTMGPTF